MKLVLFGLPGDEECSTGDAFKEQCGFVARGQRGAVVGRRPRRRLYARVPTASQ